MHIQLNFDTLAVICNDERLRTLIMAAATPAAVPEAHSLGCERVTALVRNGVAIDFPATNMLGAPSTVRARRWIGAACTSRSSIVG